MPASRQLAARNLLCVLIALSSTTLFFVFLVILDSSTTFDQLRYLVPTLGEVDLCVSTLAAMYSTRVRRPSVAPFSTREGEGSSATPNRAANSPRVVIVSRANADDGNRLLPLDNTSPQAQRLMLAAQAALEPVDAKADARSVTADDNPPSTMRPSEFESDVTHAHTPAARQDYHPASASAEQKQRDEHSAADRDSVLSAASQDLIAVSMPQ